MGSDLRSCHVWLRERMSLLTSDAISLNPPADYLYGTYGHRGFLKSLAACCAHAVAQTCPSHPMHERVMRRTADSRRRIKQDLDTQRAAEQRAISRAA